ncbi:hypothetical protein GGR57DRAFT_491456 [Xylariaceae sp. FL1272]|nr:hypothetical protein GGR57DRAFT_491456 [Xylariaceae sp. FL1272]
MTSHGRHTAGSSNTAQPTRSAMAHQLNMHRVRVTQPLVLGTDVSRISVTAEAVSGMGTLALLPNEIIILVLAHCTLPTLLRFLAVNRAARQYVYGIPDFHLVKNDVRLQLERSQPFYQRLMFKILKFHTFGGMRFFVMARNCEKCGDSLAQFRLTRVKVLCDGCFRPPR